MADAGGEASGAEEEEREPEDDGNEEFVDPAEGEDEDDAGGLSGDEGGGGKRRKKKRRKDASDLNLVDDPQDVVVELSVSVLEELSGHRKLHQLRYPTYIVLTHPNFQLRSIEGLQAVKGTALKELDLSHNKILVLLSLIHI